MSRGSEPRGLVQRIARFGAKSVRESPKMKLPRAFVGLYPRRPFTFAVGLVLYVTGAAFSRNQEIGVDPIGVAIQSVGLPLIVYGNWGKWKTRLW
jgi:hypothetical protein